MVALDAIEAVDPRADALLAPIRSNVAKHAEREGRKDYEGRARDVAAGLGSDEWAWPFLNADDAYVDAVGIGQITREIGIPEKLWDHVSDTWFDAFKRGYVAAHDARASRARTTPKKSPAQLDREIAEVLSWPRGGRRR
jgi:hypothetical protein